MASESNGAVGVGVVRQCAFKGFGGVSLEGLLKGGGRSFLDRTLSKFSLLSLVCLV